MTDCADEQLTCHYLGRWRGFGRVRNNEHVLFAVFDDTNVDETQLTQDSFSTNLNDSSESLARRSYVTRAVFDRDIVRERTLVGVALAHVEEMRRLRADIQTNTGTIKVRSFCVLDRVDVGDCDGHATMGYAEALAEGYSVATGQISDKQLGKKRRFARMDLAITFSDVFPAKNNGWPWPLGIPFKRIWSILREVGVSLRA